MDEHQPVAERLGDVFRQDVVQLYAGQLAGQVRHPLGEDPETGSDLEDAVALADPGVCYVPVGHPAVYEEVLSLALLRDDACLGYQPASIGHLDTKR